MDLSTRDAIEAIEGWLTEQEADFLYETAMRCTGQGVIIEIGSFHGKLTVCLARGSREGRQAKVIAIDPHISELEHRSFWRRSRLRSVQQEYCGSRCRRPGTAYRGEITGRSADLGATHRASLDRRGSHL